MTCDTFPLFSEIAKDVNFAFPDGKHQGFGIVQFQETEDASTAIKEMNSKSILSML
jgi:RNA recognition motif-containing protein